jgi:hypothetical protein
MEAHKLAMGNAGGRHKDRIKRLGQGEGVAMPPLLQLLGIRRCCGPERSHSRWCLVEKPVNTKIGHAELVSASTQLRRLVRR